MKLLLTFLSTLFISISFSQTDSNKPKRHIPKPSDSLLKKAKKKQEELFLIYRVFPTIEKKEYTEAIKELTKLIEISPTDADEFYWRGLFYCCNENYKSASKDFEKAIELKPNYTEAYLALGKIKYESQAYEDAIEHFTKVIQLDYKNAEAYYYRGLARKETNEKEEAISDFNKAKEFEPKTYKNKGNEEITIINRDIKSQKTFSTPLFALIFIGIFAAISFVIINEASKKSKNVRRKKTEQEKREIEEDSKQWTGLLQGKTNEELLEIFSEKDKYQESYIMALEKELIRRRLREDT